MRLDGNERDIVIVTGCNAVGKTTASNYLRKLASLHNIPYENRIVVDSQCLFEAMQSDDIGGGLHHTHDWCGKDSKGHTHHLDQSMFPFIVTDNVLPSTTRIHFFTKLTTLQITGKLWFVEWAAGMNTNPPDDPTSCIDYSYAKVKNMLQEGSLPSSWLKRVKAVIHLEADYSVRLCLNAQRSMPALAQPGALEQGTAFWLKDERVLRFYGRDDFIEIEGLFQDIDIPVHVLKNDGGSSLFTYLEMVTDELFTSRIDEANNLFISA